MYSIYKGDEEMIRSNSKDEILDFLNSNYSDRFYLIAFLSNAIISIESIILIENEWKLKRNNILVSRVLEGELIYLLYDDNYSERNIITACSFKNLSVIVENIKEYKEFFDPSRCNDNQNFLFCIKVFHDVLCNFSEYDVSRNLKTGNIEFNHKENIPKENFTVEKFLKLL